MSLAVAISPPLATMNDDTRGNVEPVVILTTDSRFTLRSGPFDDGQKAYVLGQDGGFAYVGDALSAQRAARSAAAQGWTFDGSAAVRLKSITELLAQSCALENERAERRQRGPLLPLQVLAGWCSKSGDTGAFRFSSKSAFRPVKIAGAVGLGPKADVFHCRWALDGAIGEAIRAGWYPTTASDWAEPVARAMWEAITGPEHSKYVGGRVQILLLTSSGPQFAAPVAPSGWRVDSKNEAVAAAPPEVRMLGDEEALALRELPGLTTFPVAD